MNTFRTIWSLLLIAQLLYRQMSDTPPPTIAGIIPPQRILNVLDIPNDSLKLIQLSQLTALTREENVFILHHLHEWRQKAMQQAHELEEEIETLGAQLKERRELLHTLYRRERVFYSNISYEGT